MDGVTTEWMLIASQALAIVLVLWAVFKGLPDFLNKTAPKILGQIEERHERERAAQEARHSLERAAQESRHQFYQEQQQQRFAEDMAFAREAATRLEARTEARTDRLTQEVIKTMKEIAGVDK